LPNYYPFTAIVGQEPMLRALVLNAVSPRIGGVLIRGERGTAKSTATRGLAALLPPIKVVAGCRFGCDPEMRVNWCTDCQERYHAETEIPVVMRPLPFVNLPISATEDRVVGTLDIELAIQKGERHFEPGILALANRGLLYIDEVNLLDDHVVDVLLDAAAMGVNIVEREGISFSHPARFILVGTMNPEEGELRPQLTDRFALSVDIHGILTTAERVAIMQRTLDFDNNPVAFCQKWSAVEEELSKRIVQARKIIGQITYTQEDLLTIANLTAKFTIEGHRADLVILKSAQAQAAFEERMSITKKDILFAAELALPHRLRKSPLHPEAAVGPDVLHRQVQLALFPELHKPVIPGELLDQDALVNALKDPDDPEKDFVDRGLR
jgi:Mg-chelatase subunit ChlI